MSGNAQSLVDTLSKVGGNAALNAALALLNGFGKVWFVDTVNGNDGLNGTSPQTAFQTMGKAFSQLSSHDKICFVGKVKEQLVAPLGVYGVTIYGMDTRPRHDLAASWTLPASPAATTPLLKLHEQGWVLQNFLMYGTTDSAAVMLKRREDATDPDASHAQFLGMRIVGNFIGIEDNGGHFNVVVEDSVLQDNTDAIKSTSTTIANPLSWRIEHNVFRGNTNAITMPMSSAQILNNTIIKTTTKVIDLTGGVASNAVVGNRFDIAAADFDPTGHVVGVTGDVWSNTLTNAIETGLPAD